jgi:hypothetical protein
MRLAELRKFSIRQQSRIRFTIRNGMECVITEHGIAQVPGLTHVPDFNLEEELAAAGEFHLEAVAVPGQKNPSRPQVLSREQLAALAATGALAAAASDHEDE